MSFRGCHKVQLQERKYNNWVKGGLALKYLKDGIGDFADKVVNDEHSRILRTLGLTPGSTCNMCTLKTLKPPHAPAPKAKQCPIGQRNCNCLLTNTSCCPKNICDRIYDEIVKSHGTLQPFWKNTDITRWTTHPWEIAKCFMNVPGYDRKQSAEDTDVAGLLHLLINCTFFQGRVSSSINMFDKIREWRNSVFHSPSMELEDQQLNDGINDIIILLEDEKELKSKACSKQAVLNLKSLQQENFIITTETEAEVCRAALASVSLATNELKHIQDEAKKDIECKKEEAKKYLDLKQEETLKNVKETAESGSTKLQVELSELRKRVDNNDIEINVLQTKVKDIEIDVAKLKQAQDLQTEILREIEHILKFKKELVRLYNEKESMIPASPLVEDHAVPLMRLYVQPPMSAFIKPNAFGQGQKPSEKMTVSSYRMLFLNDDNVPYKNIYVEANAGYGKTSFTQKVAMTWCLAQNRNKTKISQKLQEDIDTLKRFDLLFLLHLRDFQDDDTCLLDDLILKFVSKNLPNKERFSTKFIGSILQNKTCLVILDGLDEWVHPETCPQKPGIPHNNYRERCTQLTTTRTWKLSTIGLTPNLIDRHIEISTLDDKTSKDLKSNAVKLLSENRGERETDLNDFDRKVSLVQLGDIRLIPYILLQLICIWFDGLSIGKSKCQTYSNTIELTLQRGLNKKNAPTLPTGNAELNVTVPECMRHNALCNQYMNLLVKLGKLAFYTLFHKIKESSLVIDSTTVLKFLTEQELEFGLKIGLLSQSKDSSEVAEKRYKVFFQHKSIQEFMAALYITSEWNDETIKSTILEVCSSLSSILEMENLFVFVCGMNPEVYTCVCGELQTIVDHDSSIRHYRSCMYIDRYDDAWKSMESYQSMQIECLQESLRNGNDSCPIPLYFVLDKHSLTYDVKALKLILQVNKSIGKSPQVSFNEKIVASMLSTDRPFVFMKSLDPGVFTSLKTLRVADYRKEPEWLADILTESARTLKCLTISGYSISLSDISITALTGLTCLQSLYLVDVYMTHSNLKCLYACISQITTLTQLKLKFIHCSDHRGGYRRDCDVTLDLHSLNELKMLHLFYVQCRELHVNPACLEKFVFSPPEGEKMTARASATLWQDLRAAPFLSSLTLYKMSSCLEMIQTIPTLTQLQHLELEEIDMDDIILRVSPAMTQLERVELAYITMSSAAWRELFLSVDQLPRSITVQIEWITMTSQEWRELLLSVGQLQHPVTVKLDTCRGSSSEEWQTFMDEIKSTPTLSWIQDLHLRFDNDDVYISDVDADNDDNDNDDAAADDEVDNDEADDAAPDGEDDNDDDGVAAAAAEDNV